jgi:hypothetical protein
LGDVFGSFYAIIELDGSLLEASAQTASKTGRPLSPTQPEGRYNTGSDITEEEAAY